jgi:hypothetical protein
MAIISLSVACMLGLGAGEAPVIELEAPRVSYFSGYTQYEIEGVDGGDAWRSRLKFPVNNMTAGCGLGLLLGETAEFRLRGWATLDEGAGTMQDDDWTNDVKDIWSRSNAELEAWGLSGEATWWPLHGPVGTFGPRVRLDYDRLSYDVSNVRQWGLDPGNAASVDGLVLTYRQERVSLLPGVAGTLLPFGWMEFGGFLGVSPCTYVWDEDDHVLRYKRSEIQSVGFALVLETHVDFIIADRVRLGAFGEMYEYKSWWGSQDQEFYAGPDAGTTFNDIDAEIRRETFMVGARFAIDF